jgi:beta-lactamase superfamily II metal-dependent hydrolase
MYEVDFLPVESSTGPGSKSGDAIIVHWKNESGTDYVTAVDAGYTEVGDKVVDHMKAYYGTTDIDLVISTHPDADHINGIATLLERCWVGELWLHQPRLHLDDVREFSNIEAIDELLSLAKKKGVTVNEPFQGLSRFDNRVVVLGPTEAYYEQLVAEHLEEVERGAFAKGTTFGARLATFAGDPLNSALAALPIETLTDDGETSPRNNSSVVSLFQLEGSRLLLTGDAGIPALEIAADYYESAIGAFANTPLSLLQAPHHGSKRNVGPTILDRMLRPRGNPHDSPITAFISSAKAAKKHPSPKVVNALIRRGCHVSATEGRSICHSHEAPPRANWVPLVPLPPLVEDTDEE